MDVVSFANIQYGNNTQEWLKGTMCDPNEPQTFQQAQEKNGMKQSD